MYEGLGAEKRKKQLKASVEIEGYKILNDGVVRAKESFDNVKLLEFILESMRNH